MIYLNGIKILDESDKQPQWNLVTNGKGPFQPQLNVLDNNQIYDYTNVYMIQGQTYTLSAQTNGAFSHTHETRSENNYCTIWLIKDEHYRPNSFEIISDTDTSTGTTFVWDLPTGNYHIRVNGYRKDNSTKAWNIKIEKGNHATEWLPAIADLMLTNQNGGVGDQLTR